MRSINIGNGKYMEAIGWAKEMAAYGEKKWSVKIHVFLDSFGDTSTLRWMVDNADLAAVEKVLQQSAADAEYFKRVAQAYATGLFVEGTLRDTVTREI